MKRTFTAAATVAALALSGVSAHASCADPRTVDRSGAFQVMPALIPQLSMSANISNSENAGRNIVSGDGLANFDIALGRRFTLREGLTLNADAQAFNLFNQTHFDLPEHLADEPSTFGRVLSAKPPRQLQLSLRLTW